jgi:16S rRNA (cytosine1402-N4)-methyltransferase
MTVMHVPVLAGELIDALELAPGDVVIDATAGGAGHAKLAADRIGASGALIGIDRDPVAAERFGDLAAQVPATTRFIAASFVDGLRLLRDEGIAANAVYFDLGTSSLQIDTRERGFSYSYDAPLDMRMDPAQSLDARSVVNEWEERRLAQIFRDYGEERYSRQIARAIVRAREQAPLETTLQLVEVVAAALPTPARFASGHPAKRTFQAIRIAVNDELGQLDAALPLAWQLLATGGRFAAISFHSLEDRRVKQFLVERATGCTCPPDLPVCVCGGQPEAELPRRRAIFPSANELALNPRASSARLRSARKLEPHA